MARDIADGEAGARTEANRRNEPEVELLDKVRCPECGAEEGIEKTDLPRLPPERRGQCTECDHYDEPIEFHAEWRWERMSEEERKEARETADQYAAQMAEHQASATYMAEQRGL